MAEWKKVITSGSNISQLNNDSGYLVSGDSNVILTGSFTGSFIGDGSGSFSGSFTGDGSGLTGLVTELIVSGSDGSGIIIDLLTDDLTITGTANEIETSAAGTTLTIGLPNDVVISNDLTVNGDLLVQGTASFANTENLLVADRFVLFASGSSTAVDGGIIIQQSTQNVGELYGFDSGVNRWGFTSSFDASNSSFTPDAFVAAVIDLQQAGHADIARYQKNGNIKIDNGDIFIYA